ncbi:hypothetical protein [Halomicrococcus sp. NG-SE-24]|uniref:hypothetical protein n=1 Tax=Halomicrococcus sp. NG-SE-24 TaxID=3436928 RepID=UPI003D9821D6
MNDADDDRFGFPGRNYLASALGALVPQSLARRAVTVSVATDHRRYRPGDTVAIDIEFRNRLPVPVSVSTSGLRLWGWSVDGLLEASDEPRYHRATSAEFVFRPRERKRFRRTWDARFERAGEQEREDAKPGEHEIAAFVATDGRRPSDATTVVVDRRAPESDVRRSGAGEPHR